MKPFRIRVPATSANLGSGFDAIGLAIDIFDDVDVFPEANGVELTRVEGADELCPGSQNLLCRAYRAWTPNHTGARLQLRSRIPIGRGLGSSAASVVAGLCAACLAGGQSIDEQRHRILDLAAQIEGHADNVASALFGGVTVSFMCPSGARALKISDAASLRLVVYMPDAVLATSTARAVLPDSVPFGDAVFNVGRAAYLASSLALRNYEGIAEAMEDRLHEPHREALIVHLAPLRSESRAAGALGVALSGAGPAVLALCTDASAPVVASALTKRAQREGWGGRCILTRATARGVHALEVNHAS